MATGSFSPDSPSSVCASLRVSVEPRSSAKIAAPSVEDTVAPSSSPYVAEKPNRAAAERPTITAVMAVPAVANAVAAPSTGRRCRSPLVRPPSNRISPSEMTPIVRASR